MKVRTTGISALSMRDSTVGGRIRMVAVYPSGTVTNRGYPMLCLLRKCKNGTKA